MASMLSWPLIAPNIIQFRSPSSIHLEPAGRPKVKKGERFMCKSGRYKSRPLQVGRSERKCSQWPSGLQLAFARLPLRSKLHRFWAIDTSGPAELKTSGET